MENFSIINDEWKRLLKKVDTSALESFLADYQEKIIESEEFQTPDEIRKYFQDLITKTLVPDAEKTIARSQIESYLRWYQVLDEILSVWNPELTENRPELYDILWVPFQEYDIRRSLPTIYANLLFQSPEIPGLFLGADREEEKIRTLQAFIAKKLHPLWMDEWFHSDYSWESSDSIYNLGQNMHGDVYFSRHKKMDNRAQKELFSAPSTVVIDGTTFESLSIYQYTNTLVSVLCLYALKTGYVPKELESWKEIMTHTRPHIPNATVCNGIDEDPEHLSIICGWKYLQNIASTDGVYGYIWTRIYADPWSDRYVTAALQWDSLIFMRDDPRGEIEFSFQNGAKKARFRKTFEFKQEDIGPALVALFHLPGRSYWDNLKILNAFDWARENGYMQTQK
jgi:hypothetical protein